MSIAFLLFAAFNIPFHLQILKTAKCMSQTFQLKNQNLPGILKNLEEITTNITDVPILKDLLQGLSIILLRIFGWRREGQLPSVEKYIIIRAPHTSNWDIPIGFAILFFYCPFTVLYDDSILFTEEFLSNSFSCDNPRNSCSYNATAFPCTVTCHKDTFNICFKVSIRYKECIEEFNFWCVQEGRWVKNTGYDFIKLL